MPKSDDNIDDALAPTELLPATLQLGSLGVPEATRYRIGGLIGTGGSGEVRAALDQRLGRHVALKRLRADRNDATITKRFMREALVLAQLEHPSIVPVYDLDERDATPYFTMKRIRGMTLRSVLDALIAGDRAARARYGQRKLLRAFLATAHAIRYAHARGVIHRDLKPRNIMLGDFGEVYVLDWGAAKLRGEPEPASVPAPADHDGDESDTGTLLGTAGYMAPEQIRGEYANIDERSDIYALGAILFEILTLDPFNRGATARERTDATLEGRSAAAAGRVIDPSLSRELLDMCERATQLERSDRYASVGLLIAALERYFESGAAENSADEVARHIKAAKILLEREKGTGELEVRRKAIEHCRFALTLDPNSAEAQDLVRRLFADAPQRIPGEVAQRFGLHEQRSIEAMLPYGFLGLLSLVCFVPIALWMGVRSWPAIGGLAVMVLWSAASMLAARGPGRTQRHLYPAFIATSLLIAGVSTLFGPLVVVPALASVNTMVFMLHFARPRFWPILVGWATFVVPAALQLGGVLHPSYAFRDSAMLIAPWALSFPRVPTVLFLVVAGILTLLAGALLALRLRRTLNEVRLRTELYTWHLEQMLPQPLASALSSDAMLTVPRK
jgi:serine/threonine-protein kinase